MKITNIQQINYPPGQSTKLDRSKLVKLIKQAKLVRLSSNSKEDYATFC